jgi:L-serine dehydratase
MESIKEIYRIGYGPSSSHTMGPRKAAELFKAKHPDAASYRVTLFGSLAATGKGHLTDAAVKEVLSAEKTQIVWKPDVFNEFHPNAISFEAIFNTGDTSEVWTVFSIGGGAIVEEGTRTATNTIYPIKTMTDILDWCEKNGKTYWEYVEMIEGKEIWEYLAQVWTAMKESIERGIENEGTLPGVLKLARKASSYYVKAKAFKGPLKRRSMVYAFALAVSEENAAGGKIVTAPTCGSCGVVPAVLYLLHQYNEMSDQRILRALATAGLIGNIAKANASISGAEVGCQGEIGVACAMAAGAAAQLCGGTPAQIEYAAEMGLEHHLGLTCDPIAGLVQIPCIERNAFAAARAFDCCTYATMSDGFHRVSFDKVVKTMSQTGNDLPSLYKETSEGGLAALKGIVF